MFSEQKKKILIMFFPFLLYFCFVFSKELTKNEGTGSGDLKECHVVTMPDRYACGSL